MQEEKQGGTDAVETVDQRAAWFLLDGQGEALTESIGAPLTVGFLSQALCAYPTARVLVAENGATLLASREVLKRSGIRGLELEAYPRAEREAAKLAQAAEVA